MLLLMVLREVILLDMTAIGNSTRRFVCVGIPAKAAVAQRFGDFPWFSQLRRMRRCFVAQVQSAPE